MTVESWGWSLVLVLVVRAMSSPIVAVVFLLVGCTTGVIQEDASPEGS